MYQILENIFQWYYLNINYFTISGSMLWNIILASMGYYLFLQKDIMDKYYKQITATLLILGVCFFLYLLFKGLYNGKKNGSVKT